MPVDIKTFRINAHLKYNLQLIRCFNLETSELL
jgi:hypothetical protein